MYIALVTDFPYEIVSSHSKISKALNALHVGLSREDYPLKGAEKKQNQTPTHTEEPREERERSSRFLDGFEPDSKRFLRDRDSTKLKGKFYKLSNVFNGLKIELEIVLEYEF